MKMFNIYYNKRLLLSRYSKTIYKNSAVLSGIIIFTLLNYLSQRFIVFKKV